MRRVISANAGALLRFLAAFLWSTFHGCQGKLDANFITGDRQHPNEIQRIGTGQTWFFFEEQGVRVFRYADTVKLKSPIGVTLLEDSGDLILSDTWNHRVRRCPLTSGNLPLRTTDVYNNMYCYTLAGGNGAGTGPNQFNRPYSAVMSSDRYLFVADTNNNRIQRFSPNSDSGVTIVGLEGGREAGDGDVAFPTAIALDERDAQNRLLYVVDTGHHRVLRYSMDSNWNVRPNSKITVAGTGTSGNATTQLDNPMDMFIHFENNEVWVADGYNRRIVAFDVANLTQPNPGTVKFDGLDGIPYGIATREGAVYFVDRTACKVQKWLNGQEVTIAAGSCGTSTRQLRTPAKMAVRKDGTIFVADTGNNRVAVFSPAPDPVYTVCGLDGECQFNLTNGNPVKSNLVTMISGGSCGGACTPSGVFGYNWQDWGRPTPPLLGEVQYSLGRPKVADTARTYELCWGPEVERDPVGLITDCSQMPNNMGLVAFRPYVQIGEPQSCVLALECQWISVAYAVPLPVPNGVFVISPREIPGNPTAQECGKSPGANYQGYDGIFSQNPAGAYNATQPYKENENLTTYVFFNVGEPSVIGRLPLCICMEGYNCGRPNQFDHEAGEIIIRGVTGDATVYVCTQTENCTLAVPGYGLDVDDRAMIVGEFDVCGIEARNASVSRVFANTFNATPLSLQSFAPTAVNRTSPTDDLWKASTLTMGIGNTQGRFKVCYCTTVDLGGGFTAGKPNGVPCDFFSEFVHTAGTVEVIRMTPNRIRPGSDNAAVDNTNGSMYGNITIDVNNSRRFSGARRCELFKPCRLSIEGRLLTKYDQLQVTFGFGCREVVPNIAPFTIAGNTFIADNTTGSEAVQEYDVGEFLVSGQHRLCYCASYQSDPNQEEPCMKDVDFFQDAGFVTVRGVVLGTLFTCVAGLPCQVTVNGFELSAHDRLQICEAGITCGGEALCNAGGVGAEKGLLQPTLVDGDSLTTFKLGNLTTDAYTLCYCVAGLEGVNLHMTCALPNSTHMNAGTVNVKGVYVDVNHYECIEDRRCEVQVEGLYLENENYAMAVPPDAECGVHDGLPRNFPPDGRAQARGIMEAGAISSTKKMLRFQNATERGNYKICYCIVSQTECMDIAPTGYHLSAGYLFIKGLQPRRDSVYCLLLENCTVPAIGSGLHALTDSVQLIPPRASCAGAQVYVEGWPGATASRAKYSLLGKMDGRNHYKNEDPQYPQYLFWDISNSRWVLASDLDAAYADNATLNASRVGELQALTPDLITKTWTSANPDLEVNDMVVANSTYQGAFQFNPVSSSNNTHLAADTLLGGEWSTALDYPMGLASRIGAYRICYCTSTTHPVVGSIGDEDPCTTADEYELDFGTLVVHAVVSGQRYFCRRGQECSIITTMVVHSSYDTFKAELLLKGQLCSSKAGDPAATRTKYTDVKEINGTRGRWLGEEINGLRDVVFDMGPVNNSGAYVVCVCTGIGLNACDYDPGDFFQTAGFLYVQEETQQEAGPGDTMNYSLVFGPGSMDAHDRVAVVMGLGCGSRSLREVGAISVNSDLSRAKFEMKPGLPGGLYSICLCSNKDGADAGSGRCDNMREYQDKVGNFMRTAVAGTVPKSVAVSALKFEVVPTAGVTIYPATGGTLDAVRNGARNNSNLSNVSSGGRRLAAATLETLARNATFADELADALRTSLYTHMNLSRYPNTFRVSVDDLERDNELENFTSPTAFAMRALFTVELEGRDAPHVAADCSQYTFEMLVELSQTTGGEEFLTSCLTTSRSLKRQRQQVLQLLNAQLANLTVEGVVSLQARAFEAPTGQTIGIDSVPYWCVRDQNCPILAQGDGSLTANDQLLVTPFLVAETGLESKCGASSAPASDKAADGFVVNPLAPNTGNFTGDFHSFALGMPRIPGQYKLCYCWLGAQWSSDVSTCVMDSDFFMTTGSLSVRGPIGGEGLECAIFSPCRIRLRGHQLTSWDKIFLMDDLNATCGDASNVGAVGVEINLAKTMATTANNWVDGPTRRTFYVGETSRIGQMKVCYCSALARSGAPLKPCVSPEEFHMEAAVVAVRGSTTVNAHYDCAKSGAFGNNPCPLEVYGTALLPGSDAVLIAKADGPRCGADAIAMVDSEFAPNPTIITADGPNVTWPPWKDDPNLFHVDDALFTIITPAVLGPYRVCFCAAMVYEDCIGPDCIPCSRPSHFPNEIGVVTVRGVKSTHMFICQDGMDCGLVLDGNNVSKQDKVRVVGESEPCAISLGISESLVAPAHNPSSPTSVLNGTRATFDLGVLGANSQELPTTMTICYCAAYDRNQSGVVCGAPEDFSHPGGYINTVICPRRTSTLPFIPPVEDVLGAAGEPYLELSVTPTRVCQQRPLGSNLAEIDESSYFTFNKSAVVPETTEFSTLIGRCEATVSVEMASMNMMASISNIIHVRSTFDVDDKAIRLHNRIRVEVVPHTEDIVGNHFDCPLWSVDFLPMACSPTSAFWYTIILHCAYVAPVVLAYFVSFWPWLYGVLQRTTAGKKSGVLFYVGHFIKWLRRMHDKYVPSIDQTLIKRTNLDALLVRERMRWAIIVLRPVLTVLNLPFFFIESPIVLIIVAYFFVALGLGVQLRFVYLADGYPGLSPALTMKAFWLSTVTLGKQHFDLLLPLIARRHHCEAWPVAAAFIFLIAIMQKGVPAVMMMRSFRPIRRELNDGMLEQLLARVPEKLGGPPTLTDLVQYRPAPTYTVTQAVHMAQDYHTQDRLLRRMCDAVLSLFACPCRVAANCCSCCRRWRLRRKLRRSEIAPPMPEEIYRFIISYVYASLDASGWHLITERMWAKIEPIVAHNLPSGQQRCLAFVLALGSLDLPALHVFVIYIYQSRLSIAEITILVMGAAFGVLHAARPGILFAIADVASELVKRSGTVLFWLLLYPALRFGAMSLMGYRCPWFPWLWPIYSCTTLIEPLIFLFAIHQYRVWAKRKKMSKIAPEPAKVLRPPATPLAKEAEKLTEAMVAERKAQGTTDNLPLDTAVELGHKLQKITAKQAEGVALDVRFSALTEACDVIEAIAALIRTSSGNDHSVLTSMRRAADEEWEKMRLLMRTMEVATSPEFAYGTFGNRAELVDRILPSGPGFFVIHWEALQELEHVPVPNRLGDAHYVTTASEAYATHGSKAILFAALCSVGLHQDDEELAALTARQLLAFAKCYRRRWGPDLEPYFWIDISCLPQLNTTWRLYERLIGKPSVHDDGDVSRATSRASTIGGIVTFSPAQRMGARTSSRPGSSIKPTSARASMGSKGEAAVQPETFLTDAAIESFVPFVYAACDGVVICDAPELRTTAWVRTQLALAYSLSQSSPLVYEVDPLLAQERLEDVIQKKITKKGTTKVTSMPTTKVLSTLGAIRALKALSSPSPLSLRDAGSPAPLALEDGSSVTPSPLALQDSADARPALTDAHPSSLAATGAPLDRTLTPVSESHDALAVQNSSAEGTMGEEENAAGRTRPAPLTLTTNTPIKFPASPTSDPVSAGGTQKLLLAHKSFASTPSSPFGPMSPHHGKAFSDMESEISGVSMSSNAAGGSRQHLRTFEDLIGNPAHVNGFKAPAQLKGTVEEDMEVLKRDREFKRKPFPFAGEVNENEDKSLVEKRMDALVAALPEDEQAAKTGELLRRVGVKKPAGPPQDTVTMVAIAERKAERVARLSSASLVRPMLRLFFDPFPLKPLAFDSMGMLRVHRLEPRSMRPRTPSTNGDSDNESSSDDSDGDSPKSIVRIEKTEHLNAEDTMLELYYGSRIHDALKTPKADGKSECDAESSAQQSWLHTRTKLPQDQQSNASNVSKRFEKANDGGKLLRAIADASEARRGTGMDLLPSLKPAKLPLEFHSTFHSPNVALIAGVQIEQFHVSAGAATKRADKLNFPSGGLAVTHRPLSSQVGVLPDQFLVRGIMFSVTVESTDPKWEEGPAIGFTAQDPALWPSSKAVPRSAFMVQKTWICGYGGIWHLDGQREEAIVPNRRSMGQWKPKLVKPGDVISAVAGGEPANVLRIFVNDKLVAEHKLTGGHPDFGSKPVWGIIDTGGTCLRARVGGVAKRTLPLKPVGPRALPGVRRPSMGDKDPIDLPPLAPLS